MNHTTGTAAVTKLPLVEAASAAVLTAEGIEKSFRRGIWPISHRQHVLRGVDLVAGAWRSRWSGRGEWLRQVDAS